MISPQEIDDQFVALQEGRPGEVLDRLSAEPDLPLAGSVLRGVAALDSGDFREAAEDLRGVLQQQPDNPSARLHLALAHFGLGEGRECARFLRDGPLLPQPAFLVRFLRLFWPLQFQIPSIRLAGEKPIPEDWPLRAEVEGFLINPDSTTPAARRRLSANLIKAARKADKAQHRLLAEHLFSYAASADPANADLQFTLAHLHLELGRHAEGLDVMTALNAEAIRNHQQNPARNPLPPPQAIVLNAWALHANGQHRPALLLLSRVRPQGPDDFLAHIVAAVCWDALGERANAGRNFHEAFGPFFIESWLGFTKPYMEKVIMWLESDPTPHD